MRVATPIELTETQRAALVALSRGQKAPVQLAQRASIVLLAADGMQHLQIASQLGMSRFKRNGTTSLFAALNMVERFFRDVSENRIKRGVFHSVKDLESAINEYLALHNKNPKPFIWTAKASGILEKVTRGRRSLHKLQSV